MLAKEFSSLIEGCIPFLTANASKFSNNAEDVNDLVQDTLVKAIRFYKRYDQGTNLKGWLFVMMRNTFVNKYRKEARKRKLMNPDDEVSPSNLLFSADHNTAIENFVIEDVNKALNTLPDIYRVPFVRFIEGYRYQEIAVQQNIPLGTVKTHIREARILLKQQLKTYACYVR